VKADFWHNRWENQLTGFHLDEVNPHLKANWSLLKLEKNTRIFVPLCGKTLDLIWLAEQGFKVVGVELSALAAEAFFTENNLAAQQSQVDGFTLWQSENISIFCGDFFNLSNDILGKIDAVYDRASLIALPPVMRQDYAIKLMDLTQSASKLLITLEYDQSKMDGPPFSVSQSEVEALYSNGYEVKQQVAQDVLDENERFRQKGLDFMNECVYQLTPKK